MKNIINDLEKSIRNFDKPMTKELTRQAISEKIDPVELLDSFRNILSVVGDEFEKEKIFLPELVGIASTLEDSMSIVMEEILNSGKKIKSLGRVAIGTVYGDIHTIGKTMVATLLTAGGFTVLDLGINVPAEKFIKTVEESEVDILAMSALLTTTAPEQKKVIEVLKEKKLRDKVKIMIGGGAITEEFAREIGADGYEPTAPGSVNLAKRLLNN